MGRAKDEPRGTLATLGELLSGGGKVLVEQAQSLGAGMGRTLADVGRGVEGQMASLLAATEERLVARLDDVLDRFAVSLRRDVERLRDRVRTVEGRLGDAPEEGLRELQGLAAGAGERASAALGRLDELGGRLQQLERRVAEVTRESSREAHDAEDHRLRLDRLEARLTDLGREVGTKLGELGALRERLTRLESRVVDSSKSDIARAGETAGLKDRLARLEGRLSDLSKEQLARAVETAGLRERLFRLEQQLVAPPAHAYAESPRAPATTQE